MSIDQNNAVTNIQTRITELKNVLRLISNTINLINDMDIKGAYSGPVSEILGWLEGFKKSVNNQVEVLEVSLPKQESKTVEAEVVS